jgi:pSer/pThr/pTyr-binding forkhead associated (FHA) protein
MSEVTLTLVKFAYLAILWIFVLAAISVIRSDMFGVETSRASRRAERQAQKEAQRQSQKQAQKARTAKRPRNAPTQVVVVDGANAGEALSLDHAPILVGRGTDAGIRLDDDYVSTRHARIAWSGDQWYVEDLGSTNGTYIGAHRLAQPTALQLGSQIRVGKTTLELRK